MQSPPLYPIMGISTRYPAAYSERMGQFTVPAVLSGPTGRSEQLDLLVDTGSLFLVLPSEVASRLGVEAQRLVPVIIAGGREETFPVGEVRLRIDGLEVTTQCYITPLGPALLGAVALEDLMLAVDPVNRRLVPTKGFI